MKILTALTLSAAMVPAMTLGTVAFAEQGSGSIQADEQDLGEQRAGERFMNRKPPGALFGDDVIGKTVKLRRSGEDFGTIDDLIIDDGRVIGAVVTTGGFLGLGGRDVGLGWDHLQYSLEDDDSVFYADMDAVTMENASDHERH